LQTIAGFIERPCPKTQRLPSTLCRIKTCQNGNPQEKPLDTTREKSIFIEDIVVDNPWEGAMGVGAAGADLQDF